MSLIAVAMQIEVAFVATHHIARVIVVVAGASMLAKRLLPTPPNPH